VILYAQAWKPILTNALVLTLIGYVEFVIFLLILAAPAFAFAAAFPAMAPVAAIMAFAGAWLLKLALADPFAMAATLLAYHRSTAGMEPDPEWKAKLEGASTKFQELGRKAVESVQSRAPGVAATGAAAAAAVASDPPAMPPEPPAPPVQPPPDGPSTPPTPEVPPGPSVPPAPEAPPAPGAPPDIDAPPPPDAPPPIEVPPAPEAPPAAGVLRSDLNPKEV
jgi:outer membrane biosynthesis protein TonB